jgi:heptosyltransferase-2
VSNATKKKALVFFSAGIGDAVLLVPLVNELKKNQFEVTGLFNSKFNVEEIFDQCIIFDDVIIKKTKSDLLLFALLNFKKFDSVYINHLAFSNLTIRSAALLGKEAITNYNHPFRFQNFYKLTRIKPKENTHDALQNLLLVKSYATLNDLNFDLNFKSQNSNKYKLSNSYAVLQISAANYAAPYKNWPIDNWITLLKHLQMEYPNLQLVLLGDKNETHLNEKLKSIDFSNCISLIGKTNLNDLVELIHNSKFYLGLDSGLMHLAMAFNKPTFTIWGASNKILYGYEWKGLQHKALSLNLPCAPCSAWINANTQRVTNPLDCPDFKCLRDIESKDVILELELFINNNELI